MLVQEPQLGTGHALLQTAGLIEGASGSLVLLSGDVPLLGAGTLQRLRLAHERSGAAATVLTAVVERPYGYGRIVRAGGRISRIVEERDASPAERQIREVNSGIYAFDLAPLFPALRALHSGNAQGEYYLPDLVRDYRRQRRVVESVTVERADEVRGINSRTELAEVSRIVRQTKNEELMAAGVTLDDPATTYVDPDVEVGPDTIIRPGVSSRGAHPDRRRVRDPGWRQDCRFGHRGSRDGAEFLCRPGLAAGDRLDRRPLRAPPARERCGPERPRRQFRGDEEGGPGTGLEGQPSGVSGRRDDWRQRQRGRRHHHVQL